MKLHSLVPLALFLLSAWGVRIASAVSKVETIRILDINSLSGPPDENMDTTAPSPIRESQLIALRDIVDSNAAASGSDSYLDWFGLDDDGAVRMDFCTFHGVVCDGDHVIALDLNSTGLSGTLPSSLGRLSLLQRFKVWNNSLVGTIPSTMLRLTHLRQVNLGKNHLVGPLSDFGTLPRMKHLMLQHNDFYGTVPTSLCSLQDLTALDLSENQEMYGELPECLGDLSHLSILRIRNLGLTGQIPTKLCSISDFGCNGIACGVGAYEPRNGRQIDDENPCLPCSVSSNVLGSTSCQVVDEAEPASMAPTATTAPTVTTGTTTVIAPTALPTFVESDAPSFVTGLPTVMLTSTFYPSSQQSSSPTSALTSYPSPYPSAPSISPSIDPSPVPSLNPTAAVSFAPSTHGTGTPSQLTEMDDSWSPSVGPSAGTSAPSAVAKQDTTSPSSRPSMFPTNISTESAAPTLDHIVGGVEEQQSAEPPARKGFRDVMLVPVGLTVFVCLCIVIIAVYRRRRAQPGGQSSSAPAGPDDTDQSSMTVDPHGAGRRETEEDILQITVWDVDDNVDSDLEMTLGTDYTDSRSYQSSNNTDSYLRYEYSEYGSRFGVADRTEEPSMVSYDSASPILSPRSTVVETTTNGPEQEQVSSMSRPSFWKAMKILPLDCGIFGGSKLLRTVSLEDPSNSTAEPSVDQPRAILGAEPIILPSRLSSTISDASLSSYGSRVPILSKSQEGSSSASTPLASNQSLEEEKYHRHLVLGATTGRRPMLLPPQHNEQDDKVGDDSGGFNLPFRRRKWLPVGNAY